MKCKEGLRALRNSYAHTRHTYKTYIQDIHVGQSIGCSYSSEDTVE